MTARRRASRRGASPPLRRRFPAGLVVLGLVLCPGSILAQVPPLVLPPIPDTILAGLTPVELPAGREAAGDTVPVAGTPGDSINPADTLPAVQLQPLVSPTPSGWNTGVWEWDREALLGSRASTLTQLLTEVPGLVLLRGGDFGSPVAVSGFGSGGDRLRVFRDGMEMLPLEGSVADLGRIGLGGLRSVRVVRAVGEIRIELKSILNEGGRPYSLVEAGTGDLSTNLFRGTFAHPRALGGVLALAIDRVDTQGTQGLQPGSASGAWVRYARSLWWGGVLVLDYASRGSDRKDRYDPPKSTRKDWSVRTRWSLLPGLVGDVFYESASLRTEDDDTFDFALEDRTQAGAILSYESGLLRALGSIRTLSGKGLPATVAHLEGAGGRDRWGGVSAELDWEDWGEKSIQRTRFRGWTAPLFGFSAFAESGSGDWGLAYLPALQPADTTTADPGEEEPAPEEPVLSPVPGPRFSGSSGSRVGIQYQWRGVLLAGAALKVESDSLFLLGLPTDRGGQTLPGGKRDGFEVSGRLPLYPDGMALVGAYQWWDQEEDVLTTPSDSTAAPEPQPEGKMPWRYLPRRNYQASLSFHNTYLPTGNLEVWFDLGVSGRDGMTMPFLEELEVGTDSAMVPTTVPFYQSWFARLQIRVVTVRAFFMWENFTIRQRNQDFPDALLPSTRSLYGVRWVMWN